MLYPSDHQITVGELREIVYDDDLANPILDDTRYQTWIARYPDDWRIAAIAAATRISALVADKPVALGSDGDSIRWSDKRVTKWDRVIADLIAELEDETFGQVITITSEFLTGDRTAVAEWS